MDFRQFSHLEITSEAVNPVLRTISLEYFQKKLLHKFGMDEEIKDGGFHNMTNYLGLLHEVAKKPNVLKQIGTHIFTEAKFPPQISNFEQALTSVDTAYYMNHRNLKGEEIGHYKFEKKSEKEFFMICDNPYPCDFDMGIILGIAAKFEVKIGLEHADKECRKDGAGQCKYMTTLA